MITAIEDYFSQGCGRCPRFDTPDCSARLWAAELAALRLILRDMGQSAGLSEVVKWGHPCYMYAGRNIAILGAFRDGVQLSFFEAGLLSEPDPANPVLERQGPNARHPDMIRFRSTDDVARLAHAIRALLAQAMDHAQAGRRAPRDDRLLDWPQELVEAMDMDPELAEAFHRLTPGRQTSHLLHLTSTANSATRIARITRNRPKILAGKGATER